MHNYGGVNEIFLYIRQVDCSHQGDLMKIIIVNFNSAQSQKVC